MLGTDVRVLHAPCVGRCETAPVAVVGQNPVPHATRRDGAGDVLAEARRHDAAPASRTSTYAAYRQQGGYALLRDCLARRARRETRRSDAWKTRACAASAAPAFPAGRKWSIVRGRARAAPDGDQHRRGRAGHVQGPLLPRARPAPLSRRRADRGLGGRHRRDLHLPARRVSRLPRDPRAELAALQADPPCRAAADPSAPRRRRLHLRRRVGDDRIDRRQARRAAPAPAVRRAGRPVRPADARAQHGDAALGARDPREGRRLVRRPGPPRPQGPALVLGDRPREEARRAPRAGRHHACGN